MRNFLFLELQANVKRGGKRENGQLVESLRNHAQELPLIHYNQNNDNTVITCVFEKDQTEQGPDSL
jgi:hypothetical protein